MRTIKLQVNTADTSTTQDEEQSRVLVFFSSPALYGMERAVIESFDLLRPEIEPHFLISQTIRRLRLPVFDEIQKRKFKFFFLSDAKGWERIARPRSLRHFYRVMVGLLRGNLDALSKARNYQVFFLPSLIPAYYSVLAILYFRLRRRRVVFHFHDLYCNPSLQLRLFSFLFTDLIHNSELGKQAVLSSNPYLIKKSNFVIPCATREVGSDPNEASVLKEYANKSNVMFVGQVAMHKGVDILLDALDILSASRDDVFLHLIGGCEDPVLKKRIETITRQRRDLVKWWGYQPDVSEFLKVADVFVHPSPPSRCTESFGLSVVEAMSLGIPIVSFRSGALQEVVFDHETGLVCEEETGTALAENINRFLVDDQLRQHCTSNALTLYRERFSREQIKTRWLQVLASH